MTIRTYASPAAFKQALEQRLRASAETSAALARKRQLLVFDRFLARAVAVMGDAVMLKGGLVLELRIERARTTKDIDLRVTGSPETVLPKLQAAARRDLGDFMTFEVAPDVAADDTLAFAGVAPPTLRLYPIETHIAEKLQTFGFRKTHALPAALADPPSAWATPYATMAREDQLAWATLDEVTQAAKAFLDPVLAGDLESIWDPDTGTWG